MSTSNYSEIEVKVLITESLEAIAARIVSSSGMRTAARVYERNVRYDDEFRSLSNVGNVLRLREDNTIRLTYKSAKNAATIFHGISERFEAEVTVSDFAATELILMQLGYSPYMIYEKYRTTYILDATEIVLDEMPYGNFLEIEGENVAIIESVLEKLDLHDKPRILESYTGLFQNVKDALDLTFNDLTFDNFDGIHVPAAALTLNSSEG